MNCNKKILLGLLALTCSNYSQAQSQNEDLQEIIIEGKFLSLPYSQVSGSIEVITENEIKLSPAKSIEELLSFYTGIDIRQKGLNGVQADINMRGSSFEQVLLLINGIKMNDAQTGHNMMNIPVDISQVAKIEIIKGAAARRFGQNAYAGVINIITHPSHQNKYNFNSSVADFETYSLGAGINIAGNISRQTFSGSYKKSNGYRFNTDYKIVNAWYQNEINTADGSIQMQAGISDKQFGANGFYASPAFTKQYEETQVAHASIIAKKQVNQHLLLSGNIAWRRANDYYLLKRDTPSFYKNHHVGNNISAEINASYNLDGSIINLGFETRKETINSTNLGERDRWINSLVFEHNLSVVNNKLRIVPAFNITNFSNKGTFFYPALDISYSFAPKHKLYANYAQVHRVPSYTDLYYNSRTEQGNADLVPESANSIELGYKYLSSNIVLNTALFLRDTKNGIDWTKDSLTQVKWHAKNIGNYINKGFEVNFKHHTNLPLLNNYAIGYTYMDNALRSAEGFIARYQLDNFKHQLVAKVENKLGKYITNQLVYRYCDRENLDDYHLLDDKLSIHLKGLSIFLQVNNITNQVYTESNLVPMPGRWYQMGVSFTGLFK